MITYTNSQDLNYKNMDNSQIPSTPKTKAVQIDHIQGMPSSWLTGALNKKKVTVLSEDLAMIFSFYIRLYLTLTLRLQHYDKERQSHALQFRLRSLLKCPSRTYNCNYSQRSQTRNLLSS